MCGYRETKVKSILKKIFITPKEDIFRFAKVTLLLFICSVFYEIGISYSVFKYSPDFFMLNEANPMTKIIFSGNIYLSIGSIILHIIAIFLILVMCKLYRDNKKDKLERNLMISANIYIFILTTGAFMHFVGGTTWLIC